MSTALPTRRQEDFRYADLAALERVWPVAVETIVLGENEVRALSLINDGVRELVITLAAGASLDLRVLNAGAGYGRIAVRAELGAGANFTFGAAQLAGAEQTLEVVTHVAHIAPDAVSNQTVRSVAGAGSTVNYLGKVLVAKGADGTDGSQSVRAMLLDRTATANAKPELEIHADDVKCAHGCAVGELDAQALFYMAQRGLPPELAKRLMLQAFVAEAFAGAADEEALIAQAIAALEAML
ncbi:SufD family Fe-S cluster assembly protein [Novosphingobium aquiterrae]|uniref:SufD family Fe-S cluster assembly protein n=1 Tax=Novosphingobium aquiterrae TaxID=624388 RepID=A0ABV6PJ61_9SPHN